jgi:hypothetical protein
MLGGGLADANALALAKETDLANGDSDALLLPISLPVIAVGSAVKACPYGLLVSRK